MIQLSIEYFNLVGPEKKNIQIYILFVYFIFASFYDVSLIQKFMQVICSFWSKFIFICFLFVTLSFGLKLETGFQQGIAKAKANSKAKAKLRTQWKSKCKASF